MKALNDAGKLDNFTVDAGPDKIGIAVNDQDIAGSLVTLIESRGDVVGMFGAERRRHAGDRRCGDPEARWKTKSAPIGYDLGPKQLEGIKSGALTGSLGQQPFLQGFWPVMQLYLQIDRGVAAANLDTRAQLVTKDNVGNGRQALRELSRNMRIVRRAPASRRLLERSGTRDR